MEPERLSGVGAAVVGIQVRPASSEYPMFSPPLCSALLPTRTMISG
jgi:hypothetical protein